jgi:predicted dehydrogenase
VLLRTLWVGGARKHPDWHSRSEEGGGVLYELGAHHFDLWRFLLDTEVVHVEAQDRMEWSDDSRAVVTARMLNGVTASSIFTFYGPATHEIEVIGEAASLRFSVYRADSLEIRPARRIGQLEQWLRQLPGAARTAMLGGDYLDSVRTHWSRFLDSIEGGESPATLLDGRESLRIIRVAIDSLRHKEMA